MKLTNDEMLKLQQNLTVGKCPNCGYEGQQTLITQEVNLVSLDKQNEQSADFTKIYSLPAIIVQCPHCGHISFFNKKFVCK